ncbi:Single-stranded DNA-binding protein [Candidatus Brocadiaceae bacterium]|jgi:single-strand DNA-binding protein|nr:single-stranded DNA-binding protein [Candidatus Dojkabacteria bacterium]CAG0939836.1 Single-stranded DNA-binding protein [Candidatus Brocadiaceae bacterium]
MNMQTLILLGHSTKDAESIKTKKKTSFAKFSLAVNEYNSKTKEERSTFYDILVFGKQAEAALEKVKKGDMVMVVGKPETEAYISAITNQPKAQITVTAENWRVLK